jgi:hypothetical protein
LGDWLGWVCALLSLAGISRTFLVSSRNKPNQPLDQTAALQSKKQLEPCKRRSREKHLH